MAVEVIPSGCALGARIEGVDLTKPLDEATFQDVRRAFPKRCTPLCACTRSPDASAFT
jgi:alpha-ketoglutarate-dependent taurine dioxygenase